MCKLCPNSDVNTFFEDVLTNIVNYVNISLRYWLQWAIHEQLDNSSAGQNDSESKSNNIVAPLLLYSCCVILYSTAVLFGVNGPLLFVSLRLSVSFQTDFGQNVSHSILTSCYWTVAWKQYHTQYTTLSHVILLNNICFHALVKIIPLISTWFHEISTWLFFISN